MSDTTVRLMDLMGALVAEVQFPAPVDQLPQIVIHGTRAYAQVAGALFQEYVIGQQAVTPVTLGLLGDKNEDISILTGWPC